MQVGNKSLKDHVSYEFRGHERKQAEKEYRMRILDSLWFDKIHSREERIADAHQDTFEWIFEKTTNTTNHWDNFTQWLENEHGTYWVNGKAGSGKSTLMIFVCQDSRTMESLRIWAGKKHVFILKIFFWSGGEDLEKSVQGLLRSFLWQLLQTFPEAMSMFSQYYIQSESKNSIPGNVGPIAAWTERRLRRLLQGVVRQVLSSCNLCFFIDGLDEFKGDQDELVDFFKDLVQDNDTKVCLSSRPYRAFDQAFGSSAKLRMQDLTCNDIRKFVTDKFQDIPRLTSLEIQDTDWLIRIKDNIVGRANGVFLWVALAVKDQLRGIKNEDSPKQLEERLMFLPNEIEGIYARMLIQIEKPYKREASRYLKLALRSPGLSVLSFGLACFERLDEVLDSSNHLPEQAFIASSNAIRRRINTTCAGLLEIHDNTTAEMQDRKDADGEYDTPGESTEKEIFDLELQGTIEFIHRTAIDFMRNVAQGGTFLQANTFQGFDPGVCIIKCMLARARLFGIPGPENCGPGHLRDITEAIRVTPDQTTQLRLCTLYDLTMIKLDSRHPDWTPNSHWCARWGYRPAGGKFCHILGAHIAV